MMRRLLWPIGILCLLWCAWWYGATFAMERGVASWIEGQRKAGMAAQAGISTSGFPLKLRAQVTDLAFSNPRNGVAIELPEAELSTPTYWPGYATLTLANQPIVVHTPLARLTVQGSNALAHAFVHPGTRLEVQKLALQSDQWTLNSQKGNLAAADDLLLSLVQDADVPALYDLRLRAETLTPGDLLRAALALPRGWPSAFDTLEADIGLTFSAPLDRTTFEDKPPQPRRVDVRALQGTWGEIDVTVAGTLDIDPAGVPSGEIDLVAKNWAAMLNLAERAGLLQSAERGRVELMARALANVDGKPEDIDLTFTFTDGQMKMGPILLGPAPRFLFH